MGEFHPYSTQMKQEAHLLFLKDYALWVGAMLAFATICEVWELGKSKDWIKKAESLIKLTVAESQRSKTDRLFY